MAAQSNMEQLTPLDLVMPRTYVQALLTFRHSGSTSDALQTLQRGLEGLYRQKPWLAGRVSPLNMPLGKPPGLQLGWDQEGPSPQLTDKGAISASYQQLSMQAMPPADIPGHVWPEVNAFQDTLTPEGAPVFASSFFRFANDTGVGLCVCVHHNVVDGSGFAELLRLWAANCAEHPGPAAFALPRSRLERLSGFLKTEIEAISNDPLEGIFASHLEFSNEPPTLPQHFPPCTSKMLQIPISWLDALRDSFKGHGATTSINTLVCALLWQAVTHARSLRNPALDAESSCLVTAVNGRGRIGTNFSTQDDPYFGNVVLYALTRLPVQDLSTLSDSKTAERLARICAGITASQSPSAIDSRHISEVFSLVDRVQDFKTVYVGWDLFNSRDLTITSWADLDLYSLDFGSGLGNPEFVRPPHVEADGVCFILPRKRGLSKTDGTSSKVIDVMVMLRKDDLELLAATGILKSMTENLEYST